MSTSDLEAILEDALRDRGHPTPGLEAQKLLFHLARVAGGERVTIPAGYAQRVERDKAARAMQGIPVVAIAERLGCHKSTVYDALKPSRRNSSQLPDLPTPVGDSDSPKEGD